MFDESIELTKFMIDDGSNRDELRRCKREQSTEWMLLY